MLHFYTFFIIIIPASLAKIPLFTQDDNPCPKAIKGYLRTQQFPLENYRNSILLYNTEILRNKTCFHRIFNQPKATTIVHNEFKGETFKKFTKYEHALIFLEHLQDAVKIAPKMLERPMVWTSLIKYHFLVINGGATITLKDLKLSMEELWDPHRILRFVVVYEDLYKNLQVAAYNPFQSSNHQVLNYSSTWQQTDMFSSLKIENLYGFKLRILIENWVEGVTDFDKIRCKSNETVCSNNMGLFFKYINASYEVIKHVGGLKNIFVDGQRKIKNKEIDICLLSMWHSTAMEPYASYSITQLKIVVLVLKAKALPMILNMLFVFDYWIWSFILFLSFVVFWFRKLFIKIGNADNTSLKLLLFCISIFTMIFHTAFQGAVITSVTSPKYYKDIDAIDELIESGLTIYGENDWKGMLHHRLYPLVKGMSYVDVADRLLHFNGTNAYLVTAKWKQVFLTTKTKSGDLYSTFYHQVKESVGSGMITYHIQRNSPFTVVFNRFIMLLADHGLNLEYAKKSAIYKNEKKLQKLSLEHLYGAFLPLVCGLVLSSLVFLGELLWFHLNSIQFIK